MEFLRKLLFPFSLIYGGIVALRNKLYDLGWLESRVYDVPLICVGNLSTGGTGKSPMVEFLASQVRKKYRISILSRGYKRKTKGFRKVGVDSTVAEVGDEPLQFKKKLPDVTVAVCEERRVGVERLQKSSEIIVLDDAFQHRKVQPSASILLTSYGDLYVDDYILPAGNLREPKSGADRADVIVVTKCPASLSQKERDAIEKRLRPKMHQRVHFTKIAYSEMVKNNRESKPLMALKKTQFTLVTGIANPKPLVKFLQHHKLEFDHKSFPDHHDFSDSEIAKLDREKIILTTEKDFMRLEPALSKPDLYYLPIGIDFLDITPEAFIKNLLS